MANPNEHILSERLSDMMDQEKLDNPSVYYDFKRLKEKFDQNICNGTNILHININCLSYHFHEFHRLLSQLF